MVMLRHRKKICSFGILVFTLIFYLLPNSSLYEHIILLKRLHHLKGVCNKYHQPLTNSKINSSDWFPLIPTERPRLYFSDKYKLIVCGVPKCASTEWRKLLLILEKDVKETLPQNIDHEYSFELARKKRFLWNSFSKEEFHKIDHRLNTYHRVMTVREPLERIVSAYVDKMLPSGTDGSDYYAPISRNIHRKFAEEKTIDDRATFRDFVRNILNTNKTNKLDIHWRPISDICDPCAMKYHHIVRLESFAHDASIITRNLKINESLLINNMRPQSDLRHKWKTKYLRYFEEITVVEARRLYQYYKKDYDLFDYPPPPFI